MTGGAAHPRVDRAKATFIHEMKRFAIMFLYLWLLLALFVATEKVTLRQHGIDFAPHGFALINALVLAKVMLVAEDLNLGARLRPRPLIYPILTEALILAVLFVAVHVLEEIVVGVVAGKTFSKSVPAIGGGGFTGLACVALILFISLIPYFAFRRVTREIGVDRMKEILFGPPKGAHNITGSP